MLGLRLRVANKIARKRKSIMQGKFNDFSIPMGMYRKYNGKCDCKYCSNELNGYKAKGKMKLRQMDFIDNLRG